MRRFWVALAGFGLAGIVAIAAPVDVKVGGKGGKSDGGCHGLLCIDVGKVIEKVTAPADKPTVDKPADKPSGGRPAGAPVISSPPNTPQTPQYPQTNICIHKFNDLNGNGIRNGVEPGLAGWVFTIFSPAFGPYVLVPTGTNGVCGGANFPPGTYTVTETPQAGWIPTSPGGQTQTITIVPGQDVTLFFGNRNLQLNGPGAVCISKYNDLNGNGLRDGGEPGLAGWIFTIRNAGGSIIDFGSSDANGVYCSHPIPAGPITVQETMQSGWVNTDPGGTLPSKTTTIIAANTVYLSFGNQQPPPKGQICVSKYFDANADGIYNAGETLLSGWHFNITGPSGPITLTTDATGHACTPISLPLGNYVVSEVMQPGWLNTQPGGSSPHLNVAVVQGPGTVLAFGNTDLLPGHICVDKYQDLNRNGHFNSGEPPLAGWSFTVTNASGSVVDSGTTNTLGRYCTQASLSPGVYTVTETPQPWWVNTDPLGPPSVAEPGVKTVTLTAAHGAEVRFGNVKAGQVCIHKYNDLNANGQLDPGEPLLSGWSFYLRYQMAATAGMPHVWTDASGTACVFVEPGGMQRTVEVPWPVAGWTNTDPPGTWPHKDYTVAEGQTTDVYFGNRQINPQPGRVCIVKYNDRNRNGAFDSADYKLAGWHFTVKTAAGSTVGTLTTGTGAPSCLDLPVGSYIAVETMQYGWTNTDPPGPNPQKPFAIGNGQQVDLVFGNIQMALP
ncbi:MAG: hypothetical protein JSR60_04760 [Proteobacteria bacterium]|nr:hypothetical protein [Pseudomonadota bacterium]